MHENAVQLRDGSVVDRILGPFAESTGEKEPNMTSAADLQPEADRGIRRSPDFVSGILRGHNVTENDRGSSGASYGGCSNSIEEFHPDPTDLRLVSRATDLLTDRLSRPCLDSNAHS